MAHVVGVEGGLGWESWVCVGRAVGGAVVRVLRCIVFLGGVWLVAGGAELGARLSDVRLDSQ